MNRTLRFLGLASLFSLPFSATAASLYGVSRVGNFLVSFDSATPSVLASTMAITGLSAGDSLVGLDFRSLNGALYGLGSTGQLYTINTSTAVATPGALIGTPLTGTAFGVDFNPTVDRLRVVSSSGQNLRVNVDTGAATVDGTENFATGVGTPNVAALAYTNAFQGAATTSLYVIDATQDALYLQNPPNNGTLVLQGPLGLDATSGATDLDFFYANGVNTGFALYNLPGQTQSSLYTINPTTGANTLIGSLPTGVSLSLIAVRPVPEPMTFAALGLGVAALLRRRRQR